jgi:hypothetical protein
VDQVSRPLLIALLATVFVAAGWMAFMRPAAVESTTEEVTAPAQVATQAAEAAKATDATSAATEAAADAATADPSATQAPSAPAAKTEAPVAKAKKAATPADTEKKAEPKAAKADPQAKVLAEMDSGKVVVLLFWDRSGADDRAARNAAQGVDRRDGKVVVRLVDVRDVGRYDSVTQGVTVAQSPTTMVISPDGTARTIAGLSEPTEVDQLVREALPRK